MPQPLNNPPGGPAQSPIFAVPYPAAVGTAGPSILLSTYSSIGISHTITEQMQQYTEDWLEILNFSDSVLQPMWDVGPQLPPIPQGYAWAAPIPNSATKLATTILSQTSAQAFPQEMFIATYYTRQEIAQGFRPRIGPLVPSVPAASIGPGPLPEGVTIGADDVTAETFKPGVIIPAAQVGVAAPDAMSLNDVIIATLVNFAVGLLVIEPNNALTSDIVVVAGRISGDTHNRTTLYLDHTTGYGGVASGPGGATSVTGHMRATASGWEMLESLLVDGNLTVVGTGGAIPGATITGDIAANQVGPGALDTDVTMSANQLTAGTLIAGVVVPGANVSGAVATAKQTDSTNAGSATVPQIIASGVTGLGTKDDGGSAPNVHVLIFPTENDAVARGVMLGYVDGAGNLHAGAIQRTNGVFADQEMDNGTATLRQTATYINTTDPATYVTVNEGDKWWAA